MARGNHEYVPTRSRHVQSRLYVHMFSMTSTVRGANPSCIPVNATLIRIVEEVFQRVKLCARRPKK